ncbi:MAG: phospholipase D-like domain-containing protein, partial [Acidimicrobiia bacterium]
MKSGLKSRIAAHVKRHVYRRLFATAAVTVLTLLSVGVAPSEAQERLCDTAFEDCRTPLWTLIDSEPSGTAGGIDMAFWFIQDTSIANKVIDAHRRGVRVRILVDPRSNPQYPPTGDILDQFAAAGIPMRYKPDEGIQHWKMMLFAGQNRVMFSGANFGDFFFLPAIPYQNYIDEVIYFTDDPALLRSFKSKYDDFWMNNVLFANYANIVEPRTRRWGAPAAIDPALNFPPGDWTQDFLFRTAERLNAETQRVDIIMYRITNEGITNAAIDVVRRGVPVRLLHEPNEYRNPARPWDSWNVDRMHVAGVQIRMRRHAGLNHEKAAILVGQGLSIFGSSNWTWPSGNFQTEHNYFTTKAWIFSWFVNHFNRKWNSASEYGPFVPLPPDAPVILWPPDASTQQPTDTAIYWEGGLWAHRYDVYLGTNPNPPLVASNVETGSIEDDIYEYFIPAATLLPGTTYYWRIVGKTMANVTASGPTWSFTTQGTVGPPTVTNVSPSSGPTAGGTNVTITGTNFVAPATVTFGGTAATSVVVVSATSITATTP